MSLFGIMVSQRENIYVNFTFADRINKSVLVVNSTAPFTIGSLQKFRFANARKWMLLNIFKQGSDTFQNPSLQLSTSMSIACIHPKGQVSVSPNG